MTRYKVAGVSEILCFVSADMMTIDEVGIHGGEWIEEVYSVSTLDDVSTN
jgi:hypothetical protein